jgi:hypothetical protein
MSRTLSQPWPRLAVVWPAGFILFAWLCVPQYGWTASEAKNCTAEPTTNMAMAYGQVLSGTDCVITPAADLDSFVFTAAANDVIRLLALKTGGGYYAAECLELRDSAGTPLGSPVCGPTVQMDKTLTKAGTYKVIVTEQNNDDVVNYNLSLTRLSPFQGGATPIQYGQVLSDEINPPTDLDWFVFTGTSNDVIRVNAYKSGGGYYAQACFEVYQPDTTLLSPKQCGSNPLLDVTLTQTGVYRVLVSEAVSDDVLTYNLGVQCLEGPCTVVPTCKLLDAATYDPASKTLTMNFTIQNTFAATWNAWLTYQNSIESLFTQAQAITNPQIIVTKTRTNLPKAGKVGVLSTLTTPKGGVACSVWTIVNTGTPGTIAVQEEVMDLGGLERQ